VAERGAVRLSSRAAVFCQRGGSGREITRSIRRGNRLELHVVEIMKQLLA